ncbi:MAG TPA: hypothetical protein VEA80_09425 [Vitreimonas sp.]|uniref:hypothetical protein n=1 Tax=Vitreimonas sp. TaxID=3069702 RepID=UPI002D257C61|nr:hypothetical protein [Vitreimonas sp.]HYD87683.1 hypothetical protein [Vitreimonas sp.]
MTVNASQTEAGRGAAFAVYALYLLSIPSAAVFALIGVIVAYAARDGAGPLARSHLDHAIRIWWTAFWWVVGGWILVGLGFVLMIALIGFPIMWLGGLILLIILIWFTVKALLGLLALLDARAR